MATAELFTRGGPGQAENRGPSMVAKHADKIQKEKEARALDKLLLLLPRLSSAVHAVALQECNWDEETALQMLRRFQSEKSKELEDILKERERRMTKLETAKAEAFSKGGGSSEETSGSSVSESEYESLGSSSSEEESRARNQDGGRRKESRKEARHRRDRDRSRSGDRSRGRKSRSRRVSSEQRESDQHERKDRRKRKVRESESRRTRQRSSSRRRSEEKRRRRRRRNSSSPSRSRDARRKSSKVHAIREYGKYGIIRETDMYSKRPEFTLWALEIKNMDVETLPKYEEKELFRTYIEDYNTGTLPHRKYYDLAVYERQKAAKTAEKSTGGLEPMLFDDEAQRRREILQERQKQQHERLQAAYEELKTTDKAEAMRQQDMLRAKMSLAYRTGDQKEAQRLAEKLKPDDQK